MRRRLPSSIRASVVIRVASRIFCPPLVTDLAFRLIFMWVWASMLAVDDNVSLLMTVRTILIVPSRWFISRAVPIVASLPSLPFSVPRLVLFSRRFWWNFGILARRGIMRVLFWRKSFLYEYHTFYLFFSFLTETKTIFSYSGFKNEPLEQPGTL